jgi:hypothetical protein
MFFLKGGCVLQHTDFLNGQHWCLHLSQRRRIVPEEMIVSIIRTTQVESQLGFGARGAHDCDIVTLSGSTVDNDGFCAASCTKYCERRA